MNQCIHIEGEASRLTLSNLRNLEGAELEPADLNDAEDLREVMEQIEAYAQSGELDLATEVRSFTVLPTDGITIEKEGEEGEEDTPLSLDDIELHTLSLDPVAELMEEALEGDLIYLRREHGPGEWRFCFDPEELSGKCTLDYFDCARFELDDYELLREAYYDYLCDMIVPESLRIADRPATVEYSLFEPRLVYGELYRVVEKESGKELERVEIPGHYFLAEEVEIDELIDEE